MRVESQFQPSIPFLAAGSGKLSPPRGWESFAEDHQGNFGIELVAKGGGLKPGFNPRLSSLDNTRVLWVILLPEAPRVARLVLDGGRWYIVLEDGSRLPVSFEGQGLKLGFNPLEELPEPDYDRFLSWCRRSVSEKTCREYVRYLQRFEWPLRRDRLYEMELTKWHILALRNYLSFLEEQGYSVEEWRRLRALKLPSTGADRYIPPVDAVRDSLPRLIPRYRLVYYIMLYSALRLEHTLRLLREWQDLRSRAESIPGSCVRIALPASWSDDNKRAFYAYMPRWLYRIVDSVVEAGYRVPRRDSVTKHARG